MADALDAVKLLPVRLMRDMVIIAGGACFLIFLNYHFQPNFGAIPNIQYLGTGAIYFVGIALAYATGKLLYILGELLFLVPYGIFSVLSLFISEHTSKGVNDKIEQLGRSHIEVLTKIEKHPEIFHRFERYAHLRSFSTMTLAAVFIINYLTGNHSEYIWTMIVLFLYMSLNEAADDKFRENLVGSSEQ